MLAAQIAWMCPSGLAQIRTSGLQVLQAVDWEVPTPVLIGTVSLEDSEKLYNALWSRLGNTIVHGGRSSR